MDMLDRLETHIVRCQYWTCVTVRPLYSLNTNLNLDLHAPYLNIGWVANDIQKLYLLFKSKGFIQACLTSILDVIQCLCTSYILGCYGGVALLLGMELC